MSELRCYPRKKNISTSALSAWRLMRRRRRSGEVATQPVGPPDGSCETQEDTGKIGLHQILVSWVAPTLLSILIASVVAYPLSLLIKVALPRVEKTWELLRYLDETARVVRYPGAEELKEHLDKVFVDVQIDGVNQLTCRTKGGRQPIKVVRNLGSITLMTYLPELSISSSDIDEFNARSLFCRLCIESNSGVPLLQSDLFLGEGISRGSLEDFFLLFMLRIASLRDETNQSQENLLLPKRRGAKPFPQSI